MNLFERDIAVDMGTSSPLLFEQGKGVVAREPTVVAVDKFSGPQFYGTLQGDPCAPPGRQRQTI